MPHVVFETEGMIVEADLPNGGRLVDLCDERSAPVPFSCRSANCGTCRIEVIQGAELLEPARNDELEVLDLFGDDPARCRLACQAHVRPGPGCLRVRAADP